MLLFIILSGLNIELSTCVSAAKLIMLLILYFLKIWAIFALFPILFFAKIKYDQYSIDNYCRMEGLSKTPVRLEPRSLAYLAFHSLPESQYKLVSNLDFPVLDRCIDRLLHRQPYM